MARYIRNTALLAKIETTEGTDAVPTGSANALLVSEVTINPLSATNVDRDLVRPYFGASEQLVGTAYVDISFTCELAGSGTAGTAPAWAPLLQACGFAETGTGYKAYAPDLPSAQKSATMYYYDDGVLHKLLGAKGSFKVMSSVGERPMLQFTFTGKDGGVSAASNPSTTLTAWKQPRIVTDTNTSDITLGGAYSAGAITGGTAYTSKGLSVDCGNTVVFTPLLGAEPVDITGRKVTGALELDLSAAQEITFMASVKANTLQTISLEHGTAAGGIVGIVLTAAQLIAPKKSEANGRRLIGYDLVSVPSAGNDDLIIYTK